MHFFGGLRLSRLQESCPGTRFWDASGLYAEHNDLNEALVKRPGINYGL